MSCTINASVTNNGLIHGADASGNLQIQSNGTAALNFVTNGKVVFPSTSLGTASAGTIEYDGSVPYFTPLGTQRGIIPGMQYYRLNSDLAGANGTSAQNTFGVGVTLSSSTVYYFELEYVLSKSAGATSHTLSYGFGGTATINNILINLRRQGASGNTFPWSGVTAIGVVPISVNTTAQQVVTGAIANASYVDMVSVKGTISVNAGGTFIPQYQLSAAPGGAYSTITGSYMLIYPIGASGSNISVGTWA